MTNPTLLIANRGEIALRVMRTAHDLDWSTVAIFTDLDAEAPHVHEADRAIRVDSYLDIDAVVAAARDSGAGFVHPGYGFLSERAEFARALEDAGIQLVGPRADVMDAMGRKDKAREIAVAAGVPVVPADASSYPVLVKAAAGGGGKGMRVVRRPEDLDEAIAAAKREAITAFGDDTILIEKYVESGRHIEVQVLADHHGNVRHFFERDCSTQRRHQKVLEEAPAPTISEEQRSAITQAAVDLAAEVGYRNAGTVEFLLDSATGEFYFLEMNTRLQVEHPVTELVTRIGGDEVDLVELQLAAASGEEFDFSQDDITLDGHAIEARVYAEDSFNGFLPQAGRAGYVHWPVGPPWVRTDEALDDGQVVSTGFDPMLGKVICWGEDREEARRRLSWALGSTAITGLTTNTGFLKALVDSDEFRDATIDTAWLDTAEIPSPDSTAARVLAATALIPTSGTGPFAPDGFRVAGDSAPFLVQLDELVSLRRRGTSYELVAIGATSYDVPIRVLGDGEVPGGVALTIEYGDDQADGVVMANRREVEVVHEGQRHVFTLPDPFAEQAAAAGDGTLLAPMPGTVLDVRVSEGEHVAEGAILGVIEAMKMEHSLKAPYDGTVVTVGASAGQQVALGAVLFEVTADE